MGTIVKKYNLGFVSEKENPADLANSIKKFIEKSILINPDDRKNLLDILLFENSSEKLLKELN